MKRKWVIAFEPEGPGSRYFGSDGKPTPWSNAAEFPTRRNAKRFAARHEIKIDGKEICIVVKRHTPAQ